MERTEQKKRSPAELATALLAGTALSFGVCVVVLAAGAGLISAGLLGAGTEQTFCLIGGGAGGLIGGLYAAVSCGWRKLPIALGTGVLSIVVWLLLGSWFYAQTPAKGLPPYAAAVLIGALAGGFLAAGGKSGRKRLH